jgi:membrane-associated protease RseP (regulator of RpoE activity)
MTLPRGDYPSGEGRPFDGRFAPVAPIQGALVDERPPRRLPLLPIILFLATCYTTYRVGGLAYCVPLMLILTSHELGHYFQARRYRVPASLPYFIPIPAPPLGTMGAVIGMRGNTWDRRALFDIGITGPLAGLVPAIVFCVIGLYRSRIIDLPPPGHGSAMMLGEPLLFQFFTTWIFGPLPPDKTVELHALGYAGWVGVFITALNLMPISQLDGGHVLYALLRRKAHIVATLLLGLAILAVLLTQNYQWSLMLFLLILIGPNHPPTANDNVPLGNGRIVLGWLTLAFVIVGFTPRPFSM